MKIINPRGLPEAVVKAVSVSDPPKPDRYSVTQLIQPPLIRTLTARHWSEMQEEVEKRTWLLMGQAVHKYLELCAPYEAHVEKKIEMPVEYNGRNITVVGVIDLHHGDILTDYKVTSVWSFILGDKPEWEAQLNIYAYMAWMMEGIETKGIQIIAILRDWMQREAAKSDDYPEAEMIAVNIPLWPHKRTSKHLAELIADHIENPERPCTPQERWRRRTTYAVKKTGRKSALRVLDTIQDAYEWAVKNNLADYDTIDGEQIINCKVGVTIEERIGEDVRCKSYCPVRDFCREVEQDV
jgi:hypothetical protein